ncbi:uncharacterized protein N7473_006189 [Penicillium subrubescens]|uniref:uncharacterized protein n=1 Tax=Penicillium subrubescens TaxID=1316194 RepID=UPI0025452733|nr:uncharacterized protein N7473_006189 [Penicillium subrubescens]KAJ5896790.1 hypothetical protein N7473_006189 [Penicillium subrubescens]
MLSFLAKRVPRTITANQNLVVFDGGRSFIEFKAPTDRYLVVNRWPPSSSDANRNIALQPPLHWHRHQTETFHVLHGTAEFVCNGHKIIKKAGDLITIPAKAIHTFRNISESDELLIEFVLEPKWRERDEAFFRNVQSYRDDCRKAGIPRSLPQVLLFNWVGGVVLALPGPTIISKPVGVALNLFGGLVLGKYILGYRESYPEYYKIRV